MDAPSSTIPEAPATPTPPAPPTPTHAHPPLTRSAQVALGIFLTITLGLLIFRGYGAWLGARPTEPARIARTDLNKADRSELEQVPGIGPTLAREITEDRQKKGQFKSVEDLRRVKGVGPATFDKVRPFLQVELPNIEPVTTALQSPATPDTQPLVLERKPPPQAPAPNQRTGGVKKLQPGDPPLNVNVAGVDELTKLPGVGAVTAQRIIAARSAKPFHSLADIDKVKGIGPATLAKIKPFVVFE
jgi:competence protein ComEA